MTKQLIIIGAGGHATSVCSVAMSAGFEVVCFVDPARCGESLLGIEIVESVRPYLPGDMSLAVAVGANFKREQVFGELGVSPDRFPPLIHPSAVVCTHAFVGNGTVVMPNVTIGPNSRVGAFCLLNTNSSIDHDCEMADFSSIAPGVNTGGDVRIGGRSAVSLGARVKHGVTIGADTVVGANAYVHGDLPDNVVAYGTPAKIVASRGRADGYLA